MRFHYGAVTESSDFHPEAEGWRGIREPGPIALQVLAFPVMVGLLMIWGLFILLFVWPKPFSIQIPTAADTMTNCFGGLGLFILIIPLHELLHTLFHPGWGLTSNTIIGLWLSKGLFYAHYEGSMSRNRFLLVFLTPYVVLGVLPTIWMGLFPELMQSLLFFSLWGSVLACGDLVGLGIILFQIPNSAIVRNKGWKTYWKSTS